MWLLFCIDLIVVVVKVVVMAVYRSMYAALLLLFSELYRCSDLVVVADVIVVAVSSIVTLSFDGLVCFVCVYTSLCLCLMAFCVTRCRLCYTLCLGY